MWVFLLVLFRLCFTQSEPELITALSFVVDGQIKRD